MEVEKIIEICKAYQEGLILASYRMSQDNNPYDKDSDCYYAWILGHNTGNATELLNYEEGYIN